MDKSTNILGDQLENLSLSQSNISLSFNRSIKNGRTPIKSTKYNNNQRASYQTPNGGGRNKTPNRQNQQNHGGKENQQNNNNGKKISPKTPINGDRFIPDRTAMNFEIGHYLIANNEQNNSNNNGENSTIIKELNGTDLANYRILHYNKTVPKPQEGYINDTKVAYYSCQTSSSKTKSTRYISKQPERILDAPDVLNDYYLQLIDWNYSNILAVALNNEVYLWNAMDGNIVHLFTLDEPDYISSVAWVDNNDTNIAIGLSTGVTQIWDVKRQQRLRNLHNSTARISSMSWCSYILSNGTKDGEIINHDVRIASSRIGTLRGHTLEICGLKWSSNGRLLASGGNDNTVNIWSNCFIGNNDNSSTTTTSITNETQIQPLLRLTQHQAAVKAISWCPWRNNCLATGGGTNDRMIRIWNTQNGQCLYSVDTRSQVSSILWSEQYRELISSHGFANNELIIWKYPKFQRVTELLGHTGRILCMAMSSDGSTVVSLGADETLRFWDCFDSDPEKKQRKNKQQSNKNGKKFADFKNLVSNVGGHIR
ncbi:cell division cycle 20 protein fzy [Dermatophagoides pteronyssinus]|uniref:cell division cycle 20 protein fzy n=1 Tax=Dermatophagoides pteronyssinus TaxID=6956 RepID=UPI003F67C7C1